MSNKTHSTGNGHGYGNATLLNDPSLCTLETCDLSMASFLYIPTAAGNGVYAGIFAVLILAQVWLGIRHKTWGYMVAMILGLVLEVVGYAARVMLHNSPFSNNDFLMYLVCLTIAPALLTAAIYLCLSRIVIVYGEHLSRFKPRTYTLVFCTCDLICLVLQALGGGIASGANTTSSSNLGKNLMLAGLIFQVVSLCLFSACCAEFALRVRKYSSRRNPKYAHVTQSRLFKSFLVGLAVSVVTILVRSIYRCAELSGGFNSKLFTSDEAAFMILEGAMIVIATSYLTFLHPGIAFQGVWLDANFNFRTNHNGNDGRNPEYKPSTDEESQNSEPGVQLQTRK